MNAEPVSWVSVCTTGYAASAAWVLAEITNMPQQVGLDFSSNDTSAPLAVDTLSAVGTATTTDVVFSMLALPTTNSTNPSVTSGPSGFTALDTAATGASLGSGIAIYPYWQASTPVGGVTAGYDISAPDVMAVIVAGISSSAAPPVQPNQDFPLVVTEAAFGAQPGDITKSVDYLADNESIFWTDISDRVLGDAGDARISASRGRQYELSQEEAGELTAYLDNHDGAFTPGYPGSPYYSNALNANMSFQLAVPPWTPAGGASLALSTAYAFASAGSATTSLQVTPGSSGGDGSPFSATPVPRSLVRCRPPTRGQSQQVPRILVRPPNWSASPRPRAGSAPSRPPPRCSRPPGSWTAPAGITSVGVECWGAGGGGGGADGTANSAGGGGGGGEYARDTVAVTGGNSYPYTVGSPGTGGGGAGGQQVVQVFSSSGYWTAPAGVTSIKAECWGGGGTGSGINGTTGGSGGGGGEYAAEPALTVTPGHSYVVTVGGPAANTTFPGDSVTVTAHGGNDPSGGHGGAGGTGSTNTTHHNGGAGATGQFNVSGVSGSGSHNGTESSTTDGA